MTQLTPHEKVIGERTFVMYMLPPMESHELLIDVAKMLGPSVGDLLDSLKQKGEVEAMLDMEVGGDFFSKIATQLASSLDKNVLRAVIKAFKRMTHVDNKPLDTTFDIVFIGQLKQMYEWLIWGMSVQWAGSFGVLASVADGQGAGVAVP
jgi:hypothetical protein